MITVDALQGSPEWLAVRAQHFTASEAPAMMGASKYTTRTALLRKKAVGITEEVDSNKQRLFDRGHAAEAAARTLVEAIIGESLYPVTGTLEVDGLPLLASFDGLTEMDDIVWETKLWNAILSDSIQDDQIDPHYYWQIEQQLLVSGAEKAYFSTTDGTHANTTGMWYESVPARRAQLIAGWKQFAIDLEAYVHVEQTVAPSGRAPDSLPALLIEVTGMVTASNLDAFKSHAMTVFAGIKTALVTDADFADAEKTVKWCKEVEDRLDAAKSHALAQTASIDELFRVIDKIKEESRSKRLALDKLVKAEKENRRAEIVRDAQDSIVRHIEKLNTRLGGKFMPSRQMQIFNDAIRGLKSLDSMREKIGNAVRAETFAANDVADTIEANIAAIPEAFKFLFSDMSQICAKPVEDFARLAESRIAVHEAAQAEIAEAAKKAEDARVADAVEAERKAGEARAAAEAERIRKAETERLLKEESDRQLEVQLGKTEDATHADQKITDLPQAPSAITPPSPEQSSVVAPALTPDEMHKVIIDSGDVVRDFLNAQNVPDRDRGRLRAFLMAFVLHQAGLAMKVAA